MLMIFVQLSKVPLSAHAARSFDTAEVDKYVTNYIEKNGLPGASVVVVKDGTVLYEKGYDHESDGKPLTAKSKIDLAFGTKPLYINGHDIQE